MTEAAFSLDYASCLTVLTVAEWVYLDWAQRAPRPLPDDPLAREWIEIHDNPPFRDWIGFLRSELDRTFAQLPAFARDRCAQLFARDPAGTRFLRSRVPIGRATHGTPYRAEEPSRYLPDKGSLRKVAPDGR
jgi:hypothetical protein